MFEDEYEFDYDRIVEDTDELYEDEDFYTEDEYDYDYENEREYDCYYHNVIDELDKEQPFSSMDATWWDKYSIIKHTAYLYLF